MADFQLFMPIAKLNKDKQTVSGYASTPTRDSDGEIVTLDAIRAALPGYMEYGNIREMHALKAVGVAEEASIDTKGLFLTAKIVDKDAWEKCSTGVYKGFSIGGKKLDKNGDKVTAIEMTEISVVDRPANPDCKIRLAKSAKTFSEGIEGYLVKAKEPKDPNAKALAKMAKIVGDLAKAGPPAAHDGFSLPAKMPDTAKKEDVASDKPIKCAEHGAENCDKCAAAKADGPKACAEHGKIDCPDCKTIKVADPKEPYGDVEYADPGYQSDKKKRYPVDDEDHIKAAWNYINKPKNAAKYSPENASKVKAKIVSAWKSKIDSAGPPSARDKKSVKKMLKAAFSIHGVDDGFLTLKKSMRTVGDMAYAFDSLRNTQRSLLMEGKREGGDRKDKALAGRVGSLANSLASIISLKAEHEGSEAVDLSDADDQYLSTLLGEDFDMTKIDVTGSGDPLADAFVKMVKNAAAPTRAQRMAIASDNAKKARKAAKAAGKVIEEVHKAHQAAFMAKAAKKASGKKPADDNDEDDFDHQGAMEKLKKAYASIGKARSMAKAAGGQLAKAMGRSGQKGDEPGDAIAGVYTPPGGITELSVNQMATTGTGGSERGSLPQLMPADGSVYAGKAAVSEDLKKFVRADGSVPADVVELLISKRASDAQLEAFRSLPSRNGQRPYAFDTTRLNTANGNDLQKALFEGVNVAAIGSGDENAHSAATADVIGNLLSNPQMGHSIIDPNFRGAAGGKR